MFRLLVIGLVPLLAGLPGCAEQSGSFSEMQERVIADADAEQVLAEAAVILKREFGRLRVEPGSRRILTQPVEFSTQRDSGTARDLYRGRSTMRRTATFEAGRRGGQTLARLRIDVERQDTARQTVMQPRAHRLSDAPGSETPIEQDAATTTEQNQVWTRVRRDARLERALLDELRDRLARLTAENEDPQARGRSTTQRAPRE